MVVGRRDIALILSGDALAAGMMECVVFRAARVSRVMRL